MNILQCPNCGGEMEIVAEGHYRCRYCKKESYVKSTNGELMFALNMGAKLRYRKDFAGAMEEYERAIALDNTCAEAHWGMFLSEYGIEFVKDKVDNEYKPTLCHRVQNIAVKDNINFNNAVKDATPSESAEYKKLGESIEKVRKQLLSMSGKMQSYDIFICYKQNEEDGTTPTEESKWARDLYYKLTGYGYKVFYAEESLADKAGAYEVNIFSALNSAKVMLILGTSLEHINAVWVKNEWSRFVNLVKDNPIKSFKTILGSNVAPETLPTTLRAEQAIRHDDMDWWDKVRSYLKTAFENVENTDNSITKVNVSDVAKKRFEEFEKMRELARTAREKVKVDLTPEQLVADKKKREALGHLKLYYNKTDGDIKKAHDECFEELQKFAPTDYEAARACLLLWAEDYLWDIYSGMYGDAKWRIVDEAQLMDFAIDLDCEWMKLVLKNCNAEEKKYYNKIISVCTENCKAQDKISNINSMLCEDMYKEALPFAQNLVAEYPTYQICWSTLIECKGRGITDMGVIVETPEYHNLVNCLVDKRDNIYTELVQQRIKSLKERISSKSADLEDEKKNILTQEKDYKNKNKEIKKYNRLIQSSFIFTSCLLLSAIVLILTMIGPVYSSVAFFVSIFLLFFSFFARVVLLAIHLGGIDELFGEIICKPILPLLYIFIVFTLEISLIRERRELRIEARKKNGYIDFLNSHLSYIQDEIDELEISEKKLNEILYK